MCVERPAFGGFTGTPLESVLRTHGWSDLVLIGFPFELGADCTMREANDLGYECLLLEDCTGATKYSNYEAAVEMVTMQGGVFGAVASSDALIEALTPLAAATAR